jgi:hypothetical protein
LSSEVVAVLTLRLSHEKMVHLSHVLVQALTATEGVDLTQPDNDVRNRMLAVLRDELRRDAEIELRVRRKISSQKRNIPEGSPEWDVLFRKYYEEEISGYRTT